jgi:hypothetical protein
MKSLLAVTAAILLLGIGPAFAAVTYSGGKGSDCKTDAIIIEGAKDGSEGVTAEYVWLNKNHAGSTLKAQALSGDEGKFFDVFQLTSRDGKPYTVCFDITAFFGQ